MMIPLLSAYIADVNLYRKLSLEQTLLIQILVAQFQVMQMARISRNLMISRETDVLSRDVRFLPSIIFFNRVPLSNPFPGYTICKLKRSE